MVAGTATYYLVIAHSSSTSLSRSSARTSTASSSTLRTSSSSASTTGSSGLKTYSVTFNYSLPEGPVGELTYPNNDTVKIFNSTQVASGSFTFSIDPSTYTGSGSGHGTMTVTTVGFCSGHITFSYTFQITDATTLLGGNITVFIGGPTPSNFTVPTTCTATPLPGSTNGNTFPFLSVYPNEISVASVPMTVTQHLSGHIDYSFTIRATN